VVVSGIFEVTFSFRPSNARIAQDQFGSAKYLHLSIREANKDKSFLGKKLSNEAI
jgi:hypothetical protein